MHHMCYMCYMRVTVSTHDKTNTLIQLCFGKSKKENVLKKKSKLNITLFLEFNLQYHLINRSGSKINQVYKEKLESALTATQGCLK